jgi:uncharacterized repeat protein (TIGR01451 family)
LAWVAGPALAAPFALTYNGKTGAGSTIPEFGRVAPYTITYVVDNGGSTANGQYWSEKDLQCVIVSNAGRTAVFAWNTTTSTGPAAARSMGGIRTDANGVVQGGGPLGRGWVYGSADYGGPEWSSISLAGFSANPQRVEWATPRGALSAPVLAFDQQSDFYDLAFSLTDAMRIAVYWSPAVPHTGACEAKIIVGIANPIDLTLNKTLTSTGPHPLGGTVTFDLLASNQGRSAARPAIVVHDKLPAGLQYVSATGTDWTCTNAGQDITCTRSSTATELASGGGAADKITVTATVAASATGTLTNQAYVAPAADEYIAESNVANGFEDGDPANGSNNDASATLTVTPLPIDLTLAKTLTSAGPYAAGSTATFNLRASNRGPGLAQAGIVVHDTLPAGLQFVSATGTDWTCSAAGQVVTCIRSATTAALASGAAADAITLTTKVAAGASGTLTSTAYVAPAANETAIETNLAKGYDDGSPLTGSNNDASAGLTVAAVTPPAPVPTLNEWALLLLGLLTWGIAAVRLRALR